VDDIGCGDLVCSRGVEADDNSQMKICNKKQHIYCICAGEQYSRFVNY
jgi:hypothetical protein